MKVDKTKKPFYIDNKKFYDAMCEFHASRLIDPKAPISEYIGSCIMLICKKLSFSPNFINYPFRDEMTSDAIENCILYIHNFKPVLTDTSDINKWNGQPKKSNPFSYFTQYAFNAFLRRIEKELKLMALKSKYVQNISNLDSIFGDNVIVSTQGHDSNAEASSDIQKTLQYYYNFELPGKKKKLKAKSTKVSNKIEDNF